MSKVKELFGINTESDPASWGKIVEEQQCPYLAKKCLKNRKSQPDIAIGTCVMEYGALKRNIIICPHRLLENNKIFSDCISLLSNHEPTNELHIIPEVTIPGGNVDYFLVSVKNNLIADFVGIELQTLDTTGTVWPARERFLKSKDFIVNEDDVISTKSYGMNWKMTAKTILVQLHHKLQTFENLNKHLVLVIQDPLLSYMRREFNFSQVRPSNKGDSLHIHSYSLISGDTGMLELDLSESVSTDDDGMAVCLGLQAEAKVELNEINSKLQRKMSSNTKIHPFT